MNTTAHRLLNSFSAVALVAGFVTANPSIVDAESPQAEILQPASAEIDLSAEDDGNSDSPLEPTSEPLDKIVDADLRIEEELASQGSARVIIQLSTEVEPSATLSSWQEVVERRSAITFDQNAVERALSTADSTVLSRYQIVPAVAAEVTRKGLTVLQSLPNVRSIEPDIPVPPVLDGTVGIIEADQMWASGYTGTDYAVVILDTGVQSSHPMFADGEGGSRVVAEACYSTNDGTGIESLCPGGASSSTAIGSGENCDNSISGCSHGTHVAGIAAGGEWDTGSVTISGVAPDADIISMQVFTKFTAASGACSPYPAPCVLSYTSDQLSALQRVQTLSASHDIASVNMSLGGGRYYSACDNALIASTVEELAASGIATVIASGNNGFSDSVSSPACISSAVTVGSTTNSDTVSGFSNTAEDLIDLYAPGSSIISAVPTNSSEAYSGTSMAAPHVAGAFALIRNVFPNATVDEIVAALRDTGEPVSTRQSGSNLGFSHPRLNIAQAVDVEPAPVLRVTSDGTGSGNVTSTPAGIDCGSTCTTVVPTPTSFILTATADEGSSVTGWTGCDTTNGNTCTVNVVSSVNLKVTFTATAPTNDDFANAEIIVSGADLSQSTVGATTETGEPIPSCDSGPANSVWFTWTAPASGSVTVDTIGSDFDTILAVYKDVDGTLSGLTEIDCDYGTAATGWTDSTITYSSTASTTYFVQVFGYQETVGSLQLSFAATAPTQQVTVSVSGNGSISSDPSGIDCGATCIGEFFTGSTLSLTATPDVGWRFVAWQDDCAALMMTENCELMLSADKSATAVFDPVVANDDFENSQLITTVPFDEVVSTVGTSRQTGEPEPTCGVIGQSIWYSFTPSVVSTLAVDLSGSTFDTMVAVWEGVSFETLTEVGCNDESSSGQTSLVTDPLTAGRTYHIQIGGSGGKSGDADIDIALGTAEVAIDVAGDGSGSVAASAGGGPCTVDCSLTVDSGTSLTLTPTPDEGHVFIGWTGDCTGRSTCSISVVETANVGAVFSPLPEPLETLRVTVGVAMAGTAVLASTACAEAEPTLPDGLSINSDGLLDGTPERSTAFRRYAVLSWEGDCGVVPLDALVTSFDLAVNTAAAPEVAPLAETSVANLSSVEALTATSDLSPNSATTVMYPPGTFEPYEWVVLFAYSEPVALGSALSTIDGAMTADIVLTEAVGAGDHNLVAMGTVSERAVRTPFSVAESSGFTQLSSPQRIMDTRSGSRVGALDGSGVVRELQVSGVGGVPSAGVSGVALNVTVVDGAANEFGGFVTVFPCGVRPDVSSVNFVSGDTVANGVIAPVSGDGRVCFYVYGTAHLLVDVSGYFLSGFESLTPGRLLDTRSGSRVGALDGSGVVRELQVSGVGGVPSAGVSGVALNVTVVDGAANEFGGFVTVFPCGVRPDVSSVNFVSGDTVANGVIAPVSGDGRVCFYVYGTAHLLVDVSGYFLSGFESLTPGRLLDTRSGSRVGALDGSGVVRELQVSGVGGVPSAGVSGVALNVTVVDGAANEFGGFVTVFPCGVRPDVSSVNFVSGDTVANGVIAPVSGDGRVCFYVYGTAHLLADINGYFPG